MHFFVWQHEAEAFAQTLDEDETPVIMSMWDLQLIYMHNQAQYFGAVYRRLVWCLIGILSEASETTSFWLSVSRLILLMVLIRGELWVVQEYKKIPTHSQLLLYASINDTLQEADLIYIIAWQNWLEKRYAEKIPLPHLQLFSFFMLLLVSFYRSLQ